MKNIAKILLIILIEVLIFSIALTIRNHQKQTNETHTVSNSNDADNKEKQKNTEEEYYIENINCPLVWLDEYELYYDNIEVEKYVLRGRENKVNILKAEKENQTFYFDSKFSEISNFENRYEKALPSVPSFKIIEKDKYYAYISLNGKELTKFIYDEAYDFSEGYAAVKRNGKWGYIDETGKEVVGCCWDAVRPIFEGKALIKINDTWKVAKIIDKEIKPLISEENNKVDDINEKIVWITEPKLEFDNIDIISKDDYDVKLDYNKFIVQKNNLYGIINNKYILSTPVFYNKPRICFECGITPADNLICNYSSDYTPVKSNDSGHGIPFNTIIIFDNEKNQFYEIYEDGSEIIKSENYLLSSPEIITIISIENYNEGNMANAKYCYTKNLNDVPNISSYNFIESSSNKLLRVNLNNKWSFIDENGNALTEFIYDYAYDFSEGYAAVCKDDKWGYIDETGNEIITCSYEKVLPIVNGKCFIKKNGMWGIAKIK